MIINGFLKMTLLDYPQHVACTVFTGGCNMRCPFCHNASLVTKTEQSERIPCEEIFDFLKKRQGLLDGVAITGGEPLMQNDIEDFIGEVRNLGYKIKLDTNGTFPQKLENLIKKEYVDYVAMDIKNCPERYAETIGCKEFDITSVNESRLILLSGIVDYEFRTTVVKQFHDSESIENAAKWIKGAKRYFLQAFKDGGDLIGEGLCGLSKDEMLSLKKAAEIYVTNTYLRGV